MADRDYSAMHNDLCDCVVCGGGSVDFAKHCERHLASGEAVVIMERGKPDRVVPK